MSSAEFPHSDPVLSAEIDRAVRVLAAGGLVGMPTETVYGLAADATNPEAIARVFATKGRPADHPLIVHCLDREQARGWTTGWGPWGERLAATFWPGPLTLVVAATDQVLPAVTGFQPTVGLRVPAHPVARELLRRFGKPLAAPSANRFGRVSPTTAAHVRDEFPDRDLLVLDGGPCEVGIESTIVDLSRPGGMSILRPGVITAEQLFAAIGCWPELPPVGPAPRVAGSLAAHYAPTARVLILSDASLAELLAQQTGDSPTTLVCLRQAPPANTPPGVRFLQLPDEPKLVAARLYALFRLADEDGFQRIVFGMPGDSGVEAAIGDRLRRAATGSGGRAD